MTKEQREAIKARHDQALIQQVDEIMDAEGLTQATVSKLTGVGAARLNRWLKSIYTGDVGPIESSIQRWLESRTAAAELGETLPKDPGWVRTPSATAIMAGLTFAQTASSISVIYGGAGVGKTSTIRQYQYMAPNVWVVTASPTAARPGPVLHRIAHALNIRATGALHLVETSIIERLRETRGLLVIDEAQHLCNRALDAVRSIHDAANVGIVLAGNEIVYSQLTGGNRAIGFAQLFSRVAKRVRLSRPQEADILAVLDAWEIADTDTRRLCVQIGTRPGALRGLNKTLQMATMYAQSANKPLTAAIVRDAWKELGDDQ